MTYTTIRTALIAAGCAFGMSGCDTRNESPAVRTAQPTPAQGAPTPSADNTRNNLGDIQRDAKTPMDQSEASEHIKLTADIRRAITADDTLSSGAKNCKIITDKSGRVWLRGAVNSQAEKDLIERTARQIAGADAVTNELEVKAG